MLLVSLVNLVEIFLNQNIVLHNLQLLTDSQIKSPDKEISPNREQLKFVDDKGM